MLFNDGKYDRKVRYYSQILVTLNGNVIKKKNKKNGSIVQELYRNCRVDIHVVSIF